MEELLAKAYRDYPIGTKFICKYGKKVREVQPYKGKEKVIYIIKGNNIWCENGMHNKHIDRTYACSNPFLYKDGTWATIITDEPIYDIY